MISIAVFVIAFGGGCLTGIVVILLSKDRRARRLTRLASDTSRAVVDGSPMGRSPTRIMRL